MTIATDLDVTIHHNGRSYTLRESITYMTRDGVVLHVPIGFKTDMASVPKAFWWIFAPQGRYQYAAIIHDWLYYGHRIGLFKHSREWCDRVFMQAMIDSEIGWRTRLPIYWAVRLGGRRAWDMKVQ
jgi:hypothetical protein